MSEIQLRSRLACDEISQVLGDRRYVENFYPPGLKERTVGTHSLDIVGVSRYYLLLRPKVIVDFEPSPFEAKMWIDQKRQWCIEQGIVYVPIMLGERLTREQFSQRVKRERLFAEQDAKQLKEKKALDIPLPSDATTWLSPEMEHEIDREALRRLAVEVSLNTNIRGASKTKRLRRLKLDVMQDARRGKWKPTHSRQLDSESVTDQAV